MKITYYGQSCFLVDTGKHTLLFDPFISPNPLAKAIDISSIKPDFILVSHGHGDHVADVETIYKQSDSPLLISNFEVVNWFGEKGLENARPMNHGGKAHLDFGTVKMVNAIHSSNMPDGTYGGNPAGFVVEAGGKTFYFAGDTALTMDMQLIKQQYKIDFAFLPIGDNFTMGIDDALIAADFVGTSHVIGMHYDTFPPITIDKEDVLAKAKQKNIDLTLITIGETFNL